MVRCVSNESNTRRALNLLFYFVLVAVRSITRDQFADKPGQKELRTDHHSRK